MPRQRRRPPDDPRVEALADGFDDPGALVTHHDRARPLPVPVADVEIGMAHARCRHPHEDLARSRLGESQRLDGHGLARPLDDRRPDLPHLLPPATAWVAHGCNDTTRRMALDVHDDSPHGAAQRYLPMVEFGLGDGSNDLANAGALAESLAADARQPRREVADTGRWPAAGTVVRVILLAGIAVVVAGWVLTALAR